MEQDDEFAAGNYQHIQWAATARSPSLESHSAEGLGSPFAEAPESPEVSDQETPSAEALNRHPESQSPAGTVDSVAGVGIASSAAGIADFVAEIVGSAGTGDYSPGIQSVTDTGSPAGLVPTATWWYEIKDIAAPNPYVSQKFRLTHNSHELFLKSL